MKNDTYLSVVIPTRNRPECLNMCLESLSMQTLEEFEVIVSDNSNVGDCRYIVEKFSTMNVKYCRTDGTLPLRDSFEYAVKQATGNWVMVLGDKNLLYHDALEKLQSVLIKINPDVLNYPVDFFSPYCPNRNILNGMLASPQKTGKLKKVDLNEALRKHFSCDSLMLSLEKDFQIGAILGGIYNRDLISGIQGLHDSGRLFEGAVPDRYAAIEAVCVAEEVYYFNDNICIYNSCKRNTWSSTAKKGHKEILAAFAAPVSGGWNYDNLIIDGVYASISNILATDYYNAQKMVLDAKKFKREEKCDINVAKVAALAEYELKEEKNLKVEEKKREEEKLQKYIRDMDSNTQKKYHKYRKKFCIRTMLNKAAFNILAFQAARGESLLLNFIETCFRKMKPERVFTRNIMDIL